MFRFIKRTTLARKTILDGHVPFYILNCLIKKCQGIFHFYLSTCNPENLCVVLLCGSLEKPEVRLNHIKRHSMLFCPKILVEGKLIVNNLVSLLFGVPTPGTGLPVKDVVLSIVCLYNEVNEALKLHVFALNVLIKLLFGCDDFTVLKVVVKFVTERIDNGLVLSHHLLFEIEFNNNFLFFQGGNLFCELL